MTKIAFFLAALSLPALAQSGKPGLTLSDVPTNQDTSILIKKGPIEQGNLLAPPDFEVVEGKDEVSGEPTNDRKSAYASWKEQCNEWRKSMREMNKDNQLITLNCGTPTLKKEEYILTFNSMGTYKMRVRIRDAKKVH